MRNTGGPPDVVPRDKLTGRAGGPGPDSSRTYMDAKRILRTPLLWILVLISALVFGMMFSESGPPRIDTSAAMQQINDGNVESAKLLNNERMELTLKTPYTSADGSVKDAKTVYAYYVDARGGQVVQALNANAPPKGVNDQIDQPSWFGSFLFSV